MFIYQVFSIHFLKPITDNEVAIHLSSLNCSKSTGTNGIPKKFLKMSSTIIAPILTKLLNKCIAEGVYPDILKIAQIIPIHKKGSKTDCSNYRPISLLSPFTKIFEKCLYDRMYNYLEDKKLITPNQYGFWPKFSTSLALSDICTEILTNIDSKKTICTIFLDLAKAFDIVDHSILLKKLHLYGFRGIPLQLLKSYLTNRKQYTVVNGAFSTTRQVTCGVPQGSTLGPLLFLICINDLPSVTKFSVKLFADDTNLTMASKCANTLEVNVNLELTKVSNWMRLNKLSVNFSKTEYMLITKKKNIKHFQVKICDNVIQCKDHIKYLGVYIDDKLSWKYHIQQLCSKVAKGS